MRFTQGVHARHSGSPGVVELALDLKEGVLYPCTPELQYTPVGADVTLFLSQ